FLRLQHGRLLRALSSYRRAGGSKTSEDLLRELVPHRRKRQVSLAGLRREQPGAEMDLRALRGQGSCSGNTDWKASTACRSRYQRPERHRRTTQRVAERG